MISNENDQVVYASWYPKMEGEFAHTGLAMLIPEGSKIFMRAKHVNEHIFFENPDEWIEGIYESRVWPNNDDPRNGTLCGIRYKDPNCIGHEIWSPLLRNEEFRIVITRSLEISFRKKEMELQQ